MKKLIAAAAVMCVAAVSNAAAVSWGISGVADSPDKEKAAGWVAYFMDGSTYDAFSALSADQVGAFAAANYTYTATTVKAARGGAISASGTEGSYAAGSTVSAYLVIFNDADATAATYYAATALESKSVPAASDVKWSKDFASETAGWQSTATAAPEPTSGLLLLLGMAGLALKRKRA